MTDIIWTPTPEDIARADRFALLRARYQAAAQARRDRKRTPDEVYLDKVYEEYANRMAKLAIRRDPKP